jgi:hypothetical protein
VRDAARSSLHPLIEPLVRKHQDLAAADPDCGPTKLIETYRPPGQQALDWAKGRNHAGEIIDPAAVVTWKRPGDSLHQTERWSLQCPECFHEASLHIQRATAGLAATCTAPGPNLGESCPCAASTVRLALAEWALVPASLAYHLALLCRGCHPSGTIVGYGAHPRISDADRIRVVRLGQHAQSLGLRCGMDWDGDHVFMEKGESDLYHFEKVYGPLGLVKAVLAIRGGRLEEGLRA